MERTSSTPQRPRRDTTDEKHAAGNAMDLKRDTRQKSGQFFKRSTEQVQTALDVGYTVSFYHAMHFLVLFDLILSPSSKGAVHKPRGPSGGRGGLAENHVTFPPLFLQFYSLPNKAIVIYRAR